MIQLTPEEVWASNILSAQVQNLQLEMQRSVAAQKAFIALLENKYDAVFNANSGQLKPRKKK